MSEFNTSLVREKIIFNDLSEPLSDTESEPTLICSNRIDLRLIKDNFDRRVVIRAQNMHTTLRLAARVFSSFHKIGTGFLSGLGIPEWETIWKDALSQYDNAYNKKSLWGAVYMQGKPIFKTRNDPFMDVIEQCALATGDRYDNAGEVAEFAFKKLGKNIKVTHMNNVSATLSDRGGTLRCGIMYRTPDKNMIFNFLMSDGASDVDRIHHSFLLAANFLEGFNLKFFANGRQKQLSNKTLSAAAPEAEQMYAALQRLTTLNREILTMENLYAVNYRPEKPAIFK